MHTSHSEAAFEKSSFVGPSHNSADAIFVLHSLQDRKAKDSNLPTTVVDLILITEIWVLQVSFGQVTKRLWLQIRQNLKFSCLATPSIIVVA